MLLGRVLWRARGTHDKCGILFRRHRGRLVQGVGVGSIKVKYTSLHVDHHSPGRGGCDPNGVCGVYLVAVMHSGSGIDTGFVSGVSDAPPGCAGICVPNCWAIVLSIPTHG